MAGGTLHSHVRDKQSARAEPFRRRGGHPALRRSAEERAGTPTHTRRRRPSCEDDVFAQGSPGALYLSRLAPLPHPPPLTPHPSPLNPRPSPLTPRPPPFTPRPWPMLFTHHPLAFYNNGWCVRKLKTLVAPKPQGVLVRGHAGLVINKISLGAGRHYGDDNFGHSKSTPADGHGRYARTYPVRRRENLD